MKTGKASIILLCLFSLFFSTFSFAQKREMKKQQHTKTASSIKFDEKLYNSLEWRNIGPFRGGRSCAVTGVPGKANLFYFGSTGGGVWRTKDGGQRWENISDEYFGGSIGAVAVSEYDNNVIYVGGGEKTVRGNVSFGYGIWKTEDSGKKWKQVGLKKSRHVGRIRIHPKNPDLVYVAAMGDLFKSSEERGVYRSKDGGKSWEKILFVNADAGAVDLILDPNNPRILFASTWRIRRTPYSLESGGEGSALWKSTDGGDTWENLMEKKGMPKDLVGIIGVTISPVNSDRVWALIESKEGGVFRSDDGGENWKKLNDSRALRQRAWYYTRIYADTKDEDIVYVMNVSYHKSKDGGKTFEGAYAPHGDHHDLWISPEDPNRMIIGDDGGAQITFDGGENWSTYHNQPTAQFYRVTTDNHFPYRIYAAQQDNSTVRIAHRTNGYSIGENDWESTAGGESAHIAIDPEDNDIVYGGSYGGFLTRINHKTKQSQAINVWPDNPMGHGAEGMKYRFQWNFPIFFSPHDPDKLYTTSQHVHVSYDEGRSWQIISPDLTRNDSTKLVPSGGPITKDNTGVEYYCTIFAAIESPYEKDLIWAASDDGLIHVTRDGGKNWENVTPLNMPEWMMINSIDPDPFTPGGAYAAGTLYKTGDYQPYLYKTKDYGKSWTKITNGISEEHFTRVVRADPKRKGLLYAGTESGMYISFDDGSNWQSFQLNLPIVPITDLTIKNDNLITATQGRSLWIIDDLTVIQQLDKKMIEKDAFLYRPMPTYRIRGGQNKKVKNAGINHPGGVMVHYYLKEKPDSASTVSLAFLDKNGKLIKEYSSAAKEKKDKLEVKEGANLFVWNMRYPDAEKFEGLIMWWGSLIGPKALPGDYIVQLRTGKDTLEQSFTILPDPRSEIPISDMKKQFDFLIEINNKITEAHQAIIDIRDVRKQMKNYSERLKGEDTKNLKEEVNRIDSLLTGIEEYLYQTKNRSNQDPLNFPIRLTNKLAHINSLTGIGDYPPTNQAVKVKEELVGLIDVQLNKFKRILESDIPAFNEQVKAASIDAILLKETDEK